MKVLLLLLGVGAAVASDFPCPNLSDIYPCDCTVGTSGEPDLDCSEVLSNYELERVFQASFPYTQVNNLIIQPVSGHPGLTDIKSYVFGEVSFKHVTITNTYIRTIEEEAFTPSHDTLIKLDVSSNEIDTFPYESMGLYNHLRILDLSNNRLSSLPNLESPSLLSLDLSQNVGLTITEDTFVGLVELEALYLSRMGIASLPPNVFSTLTYIKILDLSDNNLAGILEQGVVRVPLDSLEELMLNDNALTQIHSSAITGMDRVGTIDFSNNKLTALDWDNWYPLFDQLTGVQVIDVSGNQLVCGCDVLWLLLDSDNLDKVKDSATCSDGIPLKDTDTAPLLILC